MVSAMSLPVVNATAVAAEASTKAAINRSHSHAQRAIVQGGDGRIWIATETGTQWMDSRRINRSDVPPGLAIKWLTQGGQFTRDPESLTLPAATSNIQYRHRPCCIEFCGPEIGQHPLHA
jgi:hypothetical protein